MEAGLVLVVALLVVGPERFPQIAREGGKYYRMARRYANEVMKDVRGAMEELETEVKSQTEDLKEIREIGRDLSMSGDDTMREIREIGVQAQEAASEPSVGRTEEAAPAPPVRHD